MNAHVHTYTKTTHTHTYTHTHTKTHKHKHKHAHTTHIKLLTNHFLIHIHKLIFTDTQANTSMRTHRAESTFGEHRQNSDTSTHRPVCMLIKTSHLTHKTDLKGINVFIYAILPKSEKSFHFKMQKKRSTHLLLCG